MVTVAVFAIPKRYGKLVVLAADTYREKLKTVVSSAGWRNASAKEILESVFEECDVEKYDLSALPEMKFPHFSYHDKNGWSILEQILEALHKATGIYQHLIPKVDGTLYCGELKTVAPEKSSVDVTDEDLISSGEKHFHFHLLPILYAQTFDFNGTEVRTTNVCHRVSPKDRESEVWIS